MDDERVEQPEIQTNSSLSAQENKPGRYIWDGAGSVSPSLTTFEASVLYLPQRDYRLAAS